MKLKQNNKLTKGTIILYASTVIMALIMMFNIYRSNEYISSLIAEGFNPTEQIVEVISYYLNSITPYVFYTLTLFSLGYITNKIEHLIKNQNVIIENQECFNKEQENTDDEIDDFFNIIE